MNDFLKIKNNSIITADGDYQAAASGLQSVTLHGGAGRNVTLRNLDRVHGSRQDDTVTLLTVADAVHGAVSLDMGNDTLVLGGGSVTHTLNLVGVETVKATQDSVGQVKLNIRGDTKFETDGSVSFGSASMRANDDNRQTITYTQLLADTTLNLAAGQDKVIFGANVVFNLDDDGRLVASDGIGSVTFEGYASNATHLQIQVGKTAHTYKKWFALAGGNVPRVTSVGLSDVLISDADHGNTVRATVVFSTDMDTAVAPTVTTNAATTLTNPNGTWLNATTYRITYTVADVDTELSSVTFSVSGAQNTAGEVQIPATSVPSGAKVDTVRPTAPVLDVLAASDSGTSSTDNISNDPTPSVEISLTGTGAVVGDVVKLLSGATQVGTATLSAQNIADGKVSITASDLGASGTKSLTATITDAAGNTSAASSAIAYVLDTVAPVLQTVATSSDGSKIVLTYDGALDDTSTPTATDFAVTVAGDANVVTAVAVSGSTVELTLTTAVQQGQKTTLAYTVGTSPLQDATGNGVPNLTALAVTNKAAGKLGQPGYAVLKNPSDAYDNGDTDGTLKLGMGTPPDKDNYGGDTVTLNVGQIATDVAVRIHGVTLGNEPNKADTLRLGGVADVSALAALLSSVEVAHSQTNYGSIFTSKSFLSVKLNFAGAGSVELLDLIALDVQTPLSGNPTVAQVVEQAGITGGVTATYQSITENTAKVKLITLLGANLQLQATDYANPTAVDVPIVLGEVYKLPIYGTANADTLTGTAEADAMYGFADNDVISGDAGADTLVGGAGADSLTGGAGADTFVLEDNDTVVDFSSTDADTVTTTALADGDAVTFTTVTGTLNLSGSTTTAAFTVTAAAVGATITGGAGADSLVGAAGADSFVGGAGNDTLSGGAGNDTLSGGAGDDSLVGGAGDDSLVGGAGDDIFSFDDYYSELEADATVVGGDGSDTIDVWNGAGAGVATVVDADFANVTGVEVLKLSSAGSGSISQATLGVNASAAFANGITVQIELEDRLNLNASAATVAIDATGGSGADTLWGGTLSDTLTGDAGNDGLIGGAGNDTLSGGAGNDMLSGGAGADTFVLEDNDTVADFSSTDSDTVTITALADGDVVKFTTVTGTLNLSGSATTAAFTATAAAAGATITGGAGADSLVGAAGADSFVGGAGNDTLSGGAGNDTLSGGVGDDSLVGGAGADAFVLEDNDTVVDFSSTDFDTVTTTALTDDDVVKFTTVTGTLNLSGSMTTAAFTATAAAAGATITGGAGADSLVGAAGADSFVGGAGNDTLSGGEGNDTLSGGAGADTLMGGAGADSLTGGAGADTFVLEDNDTVVDFSSTDSDTVTTAALANGDAVTFTSVTGTLNLSGSTTTAAFTATAAAAGATIAGGAGADSLVGAAGADSFVGGAGNDTLSGGEGNDTLSGGAGADTLMGGAGADSLTGGAGADTFVLEDNDTVVDFSSTDSDTVTTAALANGDAVTFTSVTGTLNLSGSTTTAAFTATAAAAGATIAGGAGADSLVGAAGADSFVGGAGNDTLSGGEGNDTLSGGAGADTLTGGAGVDAIDVGTGTDKVILRDNDSGANNATGASVNTSGMDIYTGLGVGDQLEIYRSITWNTFGSVVTSSSNVAGANDAIVFTRGTYNAGNNTFTASAGGTDSLVTYDVLMWGDSVTGVDYESIVLVGFVGMSDTGVSSTGHGANVTLSSLLP